MLNLTEIATRIKQPELCGANDIDSLKTLCETYPYSQIFPLLYLKTLAQTNDVRLDSELQKFAYRISNRTVLFDLLHNSSRVTEEIQEKNETKTVASTPALPSPQKAEEELQPEKIKSENEALPLSEGTTSNQELTEVISEEVTNPDPRQEELPSLPDELLNSINIGAEIYSLEAEEAKIASQKESQEKFEKEHLEQEKQKLIAALIPKKPINERSFTSWLKYNSAHVEQKEDNPDLDALINRFSQNDPKTSSAKEKLFEDRTDKNELFNPTKKAKQSLDESKLPVSETLAKIFAAQGNYPKAIYAYQQLMLIFPEKKVFFASQIEELNKKINT